MAHGRRGGYGKTVDYKTWSAIPLLAQNVTANSTVLGGGLSFTTQSTILRMRGRILVFFDDAITAADEATVTCGIGIIPTDSFNDPSSIPDPAGDVGFPWLWWGQALLSTPADVDVTRGTAYGSEVQMLEVDSKAMRRIRPDQTLAFMAQHVDVSGAPATRIIQGQIRTLIGT